MVTIKNDKKSVANYVVREINGNSFIERKAIELYQLNKKVQPETILDVLEMVTIMYNDFIWTCGFSEGEVAEMKVDLKQFINESIEILS